MPYTSIRARTALNLCQGGERDRLGAALPINAEQKSKPMCLKKRTRVLRSAVDTGTKRDRAMERTNEVTRRESVAVIPLKLEGCYCDYRFRTNLQLDRSRRSFVRVFSLALSIDAVYSTKNCMRETFLPY